MQLYKKALTQVSSPVDPDRDYISLFSEYVLHVDLVEAAPSVATATHDDVVCCAVGGGVGIVGWRARCGDKSQHMGVFVNWERYKSAPY